MQNTTPNLITPEQFNEKVRGWTISVRQRMATNAPVSSGELKDSIEGFVFIDEGVAKKSYFKFARHGVFVHYGVGRGLIHVDGSVIPGRRLNKQEQFQYRKKGDKNKDIAKMRIIYNNGLVKRTPYDWFDMEIKVGLSQLANIAMEYHGDRAMKNILEQMAKVTITKKR